jgi:hypothetical protein
MLPAGAVGLFGVNQGTITNVHIASGTMSVSEIKIETTKSIALGAVCGYNDGGYITSCTNKAELNVHTLSSESILVNDDIFTIGGICGTSRGSIEYSINYGDIFAEKGISMRFLIGGICGSLYSRYQTDKIKINSCINHGNMSSAYLSSRNVLGIECGGISGMMYYLDYNRSGFRETIQYISNCYNTGDFIDRGERDYPFGGECGGIVPEVFFPLSMYSCNINSCYNIGEIKIPLSRLEIPSTGSIICTIHELFENPPLPFKLPVENCFYNVTFWKDVDHSHHLFYSTISDDKSYLEYQRNASEIIFKSIPAFSLDSWPTSESCDTSVWGDLGSWNNGNPIYPKLRFEKDFRFYP